MKNAVLKNINIAKNMLIQKLNTMTTKTNIQMFTLRINNNEFIYNKINEELEFSDDIKGIEHLLSPYGTFCDRKTLYYDKNIISKYSPELQTQILLCEIFNSMQDYFALTSNHIICTTLSNIYESTSLLMMYWIGIIEEKPNFYNDEFRRNTIIEFRNKYPESKVITFAPNNNAANFLFDKMLFESNSKLKSIRKEYQLVKALKIDIKVYSYMFTRGKGIFLTDFPQKVWLSYYFIYDEKNKLIHVNKRNKIIKENLDAIKIAKKLGGNCGQ